MADSILEQQAETQIHPHNCQCGGCLDGSVEYLINPQKNENTLQKLFLTTVATNIEAIDGPGKFYLEVGQGINEV